MKHYKEFEKRVTLSRPVGDIAPNSKVCPCSTWAEWCEAQCAWMVKTKRMIARVVYGQQLKTIDGEVDVCFIEATLTKESRNGVEFIVPVRMNL